MTLAPKRNNVIRALVEEGLDKNTSSDIVLSILTNSDYSDRFSEFVETLSRYYTKWQILVDSLSQKPEY